MTQTSFSGKNGFRKFSAMVLCTMCFILVPANPLRATEPPPAFQPGEKLTFELRWSFINAGSAVLEILPIETINGVDAYHFVMTVKTNGFFDKLYKVRDRFDAFCDVAMNRSLYYKKNQREGRSKRDVVIDFDWENNLAQYSNYGKPLAPISILPGTFDPLSAFYFSRVFDWDNQKIMERPVTDGKKLIMGKGRLQKKEKITVPAGTFDTFLFEPDVEDAGGVFEKSKDAKIEIWVTADHRKIPVRLKSKVVVGSFVGELVSMEGVTDPL
jgi:hypothetical protein